jgi:hypothetical protein
MAYPIYNGVHKITILYTEVDDKPLQYIGLIWKHSMKDCFGSQTVLIDVLESNMNKPLNREWQRMERNLIILSDYTLPGVTMKYKDGKPLFLDIVTNEDIRKQYTWQARVKRYLEKLIMG